MSPIIRFVLHNKFAVWLLTIMVTVAGIYAGTNMKLETIPNITTPFVTVSTVFPGATPEEVDEEVSQPLEQRLRNLGGLDSISSSSMTNVSVMQITYNFEKDMDEAMTEIEEALAEVALPDNAQEPEASQLSLNAFPVIGLSISNDELSLEQLTAQVEDEIIPSLEGLEGVASVQASGQQVNEVQLTYNEERMAELGLSQETVEGIIQGSKVNFPLGLYTLDGTEQSVVLDGNITTLEDLQSLDIPVVPQAPAGEGIAPNQGASGAQTQEQPSTQIPTVTLDEIATIEVVGEAESISRTNGSQSIGMNIVKTQDANTVDVVNQVKDAAAQFEADLGSEIITTLDQGQPIEDSVATMLSKAIFGALFAMLIILLFLRNFRTTIISVVSIPLSLLIAVLLLEQMDITLNMMTLGAMTVAIGRVVDDSIVVVENIYRRMALQNEKLKGKELILSATKEMFMPILSSTVVTIAVFLPLGLVSGMVGELFLPFALTIVFALLASLLVAITIVPMMAHSFFKNGVKGKAITHDDKPGKIVEFYKKVLRWSLNHKVITSGIAILLLVGSVALIPVVGVSFLPEQEQKMVVATYNPDAGQTLDEVEEIATEAEEYFLGRPNVEIVQFSLGGENPMSQGSTNQALFFVMYDAETENFADESKKVLEDLQASTDKGEWGSLDMAAMGGASNQIQLSVYGNDLEEIKPIVEDVQALMNEHGSIENVESTLADPYREYTFVADQQQLSQLGLTAGQIGMVFNQAGEPPVLTTIENDGEELNVTVQVEQEEYSDINDLLSKEIQSPLGMSVTIDDVVELEEGETADTVSRNDGRIYAQVSGEMTADDVAAVSTDIQSEVDALDLPAGVDISMGGVTQDIEESFTQLGLAMLAAIAIVYFVLVITFGGALAPFAILFSLPFTVIGGVVALLVTGETLSISAMIGALMLIGIVVTNAIVLIDRVIHKEKEGMSTREALLEAGATRLRPILMTAIATIGALLPLAFGMEGSGLISKGLGVTVIGGLTSSTLLTLLIVPIVYEALSKFKRANK
ncbi:efflux RND transporter permease subunit [Bacillus fonticola]|uniref:efflux RND transporter permease subunit n=1 Tax=Bacillus fonticola TaxID=2728853 RepID=UPI001474EBE1|nr:efflux RND transporter permease subunit [Bacillus fonticola]